MNTNIDAKISEMFSPSDLDEALSLVKSIDKDMTMESEGNLENTRLAVVTLSKGSLDELRHYVNRAKQDFRDVVMWAHEEK